MAGGFLCFSFVTVLLLVLLKIYTKLATGWCRSQTCLVGKTALITGANTGIGFETALDFAKRGAKVILACRNEAKGEAAVAKIVKQTGNYNVSLKIVNLCSFASVRSLAEDINANEERLDILVNNAGAGGIGNRKTEDGQQVVMQTNYLSGFLLTNLLLDLLKKSSPSRIINVSSLAAKYAVLDLNKLDRFPGHYIIYSNTKLCNILFTKELSKKLQGTGVTTYSLHPGVVKTEIFRRARRSFLFNTFIQMSKNIYFKTSEEGAQTTIYTSVAKDIEEDSGEHFHDCRKVPIYATVNSKQATRLWEKSVEIVGI